MRFEEFLPKDKLRALFAHHCKCRPLDFTRASDDHAAIHDCDTGILLDIQIALNIRTFGGITMHIRELLDKMDGL